MAKISSLRLNIKKLVFFWWILKGSDWSRDLKFWTDLAFSWPATIYQTIIKKRKLETYDMKTDLFSRPIWSLQAVRTLGNHIDLQLVFTFRIIKIPRKMTRKDMLWVSDPGLFVLSSEKVSELQRHVEHIFSLIHSWAGCM